MPDLLRVNMASRECRCEKMPERLARLGGRGLATILVAGEVDPASDPLKAANKLVFAPGLLAGTQCANADRVSVVFKSPITGGLKESNAGGLPGGHLAKLGLAALVIEEAAPDGIWLQLELDARGARLVPSTVAGCNNFAAVKALSRHYGEECSHISIGRAGEFRLPTACIAFTDSMRQPSHHAGRWGSGAVMGAKGLKAVIINPEGAVSPVARDEGMFLAAARRFAALLTAQAGRAGNGGALRSCTGCVIQCRKTDAPDGKKGGSPGAWAGLKKFPDYV
jgi:aldehyde:ferredoxin oxidoreductase